MSSSIFTKRKLLGFLMILCLLSAVCIAPVSASKLTFDDNGKITEVKNKSGTYTMVGVNISYKEEPGLLGLGSTMHITISPAKDKAKK